MSCLDTFFVLCSQPFDCRQILLFDAGAVEDTPCQRIEDRHIVLVDSTCLIKTTALGKCGMNMGASTMQS